MQKKNEERKKRRLISFTGDDPFKRKEDEI